MGLSITKGAEVLGVTRLTLSNLVNAKNGVSPEMAIRLSKAFGSSPELWLGMQMDYDLAQAEKHAAKIKVKPFKPQPESRMTDTVLEKRNVVQSDGSLSCSVPYIEWTPETVTLRLHGEFSAADLRAIAGHIDPADQSTKEAFEAGRDFAVNGPNQTNCNYRHFATRELKDAWTNGLTSVLRAEPPSK